MYISDPFHYGKVACEIREVRLSGNAIPTCDNLASETRDVLYNKPEEDIDECFFPEQVDQMGRTRRRLTSRNLPGHIRTEPLNWICKSHSIRPDPVPTPTQKEFSVLFRLPHSIRGQNPEPNRSNHKSSYEDDPTYRGIRLSKHLCDSIHFRSPTTPD